MKKNGKKLLILGTALIANSIGAYTSNTGSTAEYAQLLGNELNLPVHSLQQAKNKVPAGSEIIYLGWIMAGGIKGYKEAAKWSVGTIDRVL